MELGLAHLVPGLRAGGPAGGQGRLGGPATWAPCPEAGPRRGLAVSLHQVADLGVGGEWGAQ
eukprot:9047821-Pyramimonas_sp.AAC.1